MDAQHGHDNEVRRVARGESDVHNDWKGISEARTSTENESECH